MQVGHIGGSITQMDGHRPLLQVLRHASRAIRLFYSERSVPLLQAFLSERFPTAPIEFVDAGLSSTCRWTSVSLTALDPLPNDSNVHPLIQTRVLSSSSFCFEQLC